MAVRSPLYYSTGNLREMSSTKVNEVITQTIYQYSLNPSVVLTVSSPNNVSPNIGTMDDTRLIAGATSSNPSAFPNPPDTTTKTVNRNYVAQTVQTVSAATNSFRDLGYSRPMYWNGSAIVPMTDQDIKDTFIFPAALKLGLATTTTDQGGTYRVHTSSSLSGHTLVESSGSSNAIYSDTRADASLYDTVNETADQPQTIQDYFLFKINGLNASYSAPISNLTVNDKFQTLSKSNFGSLLQQYIRHAVANESGYQLSYNIGTTGSGVIRGSGMSDTKLDSQTRNTKRINSNDYRSQDVPSGSPTTINTYYLRINQT